MGYLEDLHGKLARGTGRKIYGTFVGKQAVEAAGGEWEDAAIQRVDYWDEHDREDPSCPHPWTDMTLMVYSRQVGDYRPATVEDLERAGFAPSPCEECGAGA